MKNSNNKVWKPNSIIYNFGDEPKCAFLIISGTVEFYSENNVLLGSAGQTEVFGEISCYLNKRHSVTAKAKTDLAAKLIPKNEFSKIIKNAHPVIMGMLRSTYHRLAESNIQREYSQEEIEKYTLMYQNNIENKEEIKNKIDTIQQKLDKNTKQ
jgi:CRP-like cAMP-binding protein